jgi:hypothetical protein
MSIAGLQRSILPKTQDPLSVMLNIKRLDFKQVRDFAFNLNTNQKDYLLKGKAQENPLLIKGKLYKTVMVVMNIARRDKNPYHKSSITVILLPDVQNIPLLIKVFASGILLNVKLIDVR